MVPKNSLWAETSTYVQKSFSLNKALYNILPSKLKFTHDDKKLMFLAGAHRSMLYVVDLETGSLQKCPWYIQVVLQKGTLSRSIAGCFISDEVINFLQFNLACEYPLKIFLVYILVYIYI